MALVTFSALILDSHPFGDSSMMIRTFSAEHGRLGVSAKGIARPDRRSTGAALQPLATVELSVYLREGAEVATLRDASVLIERQELHRDLKRFALAAVAAEMAAECCEQGQPSPEMYALLEELLGLLEACPEAELSLIACHGMIRILREAGYEPGIDPRMFTAPRAPGTKPRVFMLDLREGAIRLPEGKQPPAPVSWPQFPHHQAREFPLPPEAVRVVYEDQEEMEKPLTGPWTELPPGAATQLLEGLVRLAEDHLDRQIRSARFWRSMARKPASA